MDFEQEIVQVFAKHNINLNEKQITKFKKYFKLLVLWNEKFNLTSIVEQSEVIEKHFLDSCLGLFVLENSKVKVVDIGSGAGFPGIPLKIVYDNLDVTLIDSVNKKVNFLNEVIKELKLEDIRAIHFRAEDVALNNEYRQNFDVSTSRAVAPLNTLSEYCLPFCKIGGKFFAYKAKNFEQEVEESKKAIKVLGGKIKEIKKFDLNNNERNLIIIEKNSDSPAIYPRDKNKPRLKPII